MRVLEPADVGPWVREVLLNPHREKPVVAVTTHPRTGNTWIEPKDLAATLEDLADVVCLETGDATWELTDAVPPRLDVYGGAVRVWWPDLREDSDPYDHRLYFIRSAGQARAVFDEIVRSVRQEAKKPEKAAIATATVRSISGTTVELEAGEFEGELRYADIPLAELARCLAVGMELRARPVQPLGDGRWEFSVQGLLPSPWEWAAQVLEAEAVVTGRVQATRDFGVFVEVLPRVTGLVHVSEIDWTYVNSVEEFVKPGELVAVKVMTFDPTNRKLELSIKRAYGGDPRDVPPLVPGGVPFAWPTEEAPAQAEPPASATALQEQVTSLTAELDAAIADRKALRDRNRELSKQLRSAEDRVQRVERELAPELDPLSSERAFLLGVRLTYARLLDEGTRHDYPLQRMRVGPSFLESLRRLDGVDTEKVLEVCAQVAACMAHELTAREVHQLRDGSRGAGGRVRSSDQAQAWRCSLQVNTPSARRLHWWAIPGNEGQIIEFASVGVHDDFSIPE